MTDCYTRSADGSYYPGSSNGKPNMDSSLTGGVGQAAGKYEMLATVS